MSQITYKIETITPDRARKLLDKAMKAYSDTFRQRHVKQSKVDEYARDMADGKWQENGESIIIDKHGILKDGQHRLLACIKANTSFKTLVVNGVDPDVFKTIDTGASRSGGDVLTISGHTCGTHLATALNVIEKIERAKGRLSSKAWGTWAAKSQLTDLVAKHQELPDFVSKAGGVRDLMSHGLAGALWYMFAKKDAMLADAFFDSLKTGEGLKSGDPIYALRERLLRDRAIRPRPPMEHTAELVVRAWNAVRKSKTLGKIQRGNAGNEFDVAIL